MAWKDSSESWSSLKDLKKSNPVKILEFIKTKDINNEPAFIWWIFFFFRKKDFIIVKLKTRVRKQSINIVLKYSFLSNIRIKLTRRITIFFGVMLLKKY